MNSAFYQVSGTDSNHEAKTVSIWCRSESGDSYVLAGSGHVVGVNGHLPPGIRAGQFSVVFLLPPGCSPDSIVVTDDTNGKEFLAGVTVTHCSTLKSFRSEATATPPGFGVLAKGTNGLYQSLPSRDGAQQESEA